MESKVKIECIGCHIQFRDISYIKMIKKTKWYFSCFYSNVILCPECKVIYDHYPHHDSFYLVSKIEKAREVINKKKKVIKFLQPFPNINILMEMAIYENKLRLSEKIQKKYQELNQVYDNYQDIIDGKIILDNPSEAYLDWIDYTKMFQLQMIKERGFQYPEIVLNIYQRASIIFPDNKVFQDLIYVKYNRTGECQVKIGDIVPDVKLWKSTESIGTIRNFITLTHLKDLISNSQPTLLVAGSYT